MEAVGIMGFLDCNDYWILHPQPEKTFLAPTRIGKKVTARSVLWGNLLFTLVRAIRNTKK